MINITNPLSHEHDHNPYSSTAYTFHRAMPSIHDSRYRLPSHNSLNDAICDGRSFGAVHDLTVPLTIVSDGNNGNQDDTESNNNHNNRDNHSNHDHSSMKTEETCARVGGEKRRSWIG